ncbi:MAG: peptidoglycan-binding protein [Clostridia bacterium]|nr:peptidoglycan-binding protein [Clostridia bacterium]
MAIEPTIPDSITVHLGPPDREAPDVTLSYTDYLKNVASSEIYPTWEEEAIRANVLAQNSFALNRVYTEYYRSRGYPFDITNDIARDQSFVYGRDIFENVGRIVDENFDTYIRRPGAVEPLFAAYCDGVEVVCDGFSQWGSQQLASEGLSAEAILRRYFGDIELVRDVPVGGSVSSAPKVPLRLGSIGPNTQRLQVRLNRISTDFPAIPKIYPADGVFGPETEAAVRAFQRTFSMTEDGVVGSGTWYRINAIYTAVKRLADLNSEGLRPEEVATQFPEALRRGSSGVAVRAMQYYLSYVGRFVDTVPTVTADGVFGPETERAVRAFQETYGLTVDGVVGELTWDALYRVYLGMVESIPLYYREGVTVPFPGVIIKIGTEGESVRLLQNYLNYIAATFSEIPRVSVTGYYGTATAAAVDAFVRLFGITALPGVVDSIVWNAITDVYDDLWVGNRVSDGQYPGVLGA